MKTKIVVRGIFLLGCSLFFIATPAHAGPTDVITEIRFVGNKKTRPQIMLQEMLLRVGDPVDSAKIERSRQAIMDLELFQSVDTDLMDSEKGKILVIKVVEKHYLFILPKLGRSGDGDIAYGAQLRIDNLAGLNQRLEMKYKVKDISDDVVDEERSYRIAYSYPRIMGGPYQLDVEVKQEISDLDAERNGLTGRYEKDVEKVEVGVFRWYQLRGPSIGWRVSGGLLWSDTTYDYVSGAAGLFAGGKAVAVRGGIRYTDVHNYLFSRAGKEYGYSLELASSGLGSEINYNRQELYYRSYRRVLKRPHTNLNVQFRLAAANKSLFNEYFFSIGGSSGLRGYERKGLKGNAFVLTNVEFLTPLRSSYYPLRGVLFADIGDAYDSLSDFDLSKLKTSVGMGLRWTIKSFVKLDLRLDAAYAVDTGETKIYAGTKQVF